MIPGLSAVIAQLPWHVWTAERSAVLAGNIRFSVRPERSLQEFTNVSDGARDRACVEVMEAFIRGILRLVFEVCRTKLNVRRLMVLS